MEQLPAVPQWLANAVMAAGLTTAYNADDWMRVADHAANTVEPANDEPPPSLN